MVIEKTYKIIANGEIHTFYTFLTEEAFYSMLDNMYGEGNYRTLEVDWEVQ